MSNTSFRALAFIGLAQDIKKVIDKHLIKEKSGCQPSCLSCTKFDERTELCEPYQQRPPARIIAFGCNLYVDNDDIPF